MKNKLYNPELEKAIAKIQEIKAKTVCIQLPDGMKPYAQEIEQEITTKTGARVLIWLGSNFGACDIPLGLNRMGVDLLISWGHNKFHKKEEW
ncbi:diphthamide synthesis protein [Candidatus Woesearchaeota archaeon]|nr:diphthamide synthesis protein [Candidatus Woesearchaeota archaeon]